MDYLNEEEDVRFLEGLEPDRVFHFFEDISRIPRGSGDTGKIRDYLEAFAASRDLPCSVDEAGNVLIRKTASQGREDRPAVILQSHMDMVCVKKPESTHNFSRDALDLFVEGDLLYADGTSLGADDGIGMALTLAVLDSDDIEHPPIEALFTNDEEIGLLGAAAFDVSALEGKRMINLDSGEGNIITAACAGGVTLYCILPVQKIRTRGLPVSFNITGLTGGHSGSDIHIGRANAIVLAGRLLNELGSAAAFSLEGVSGGDKDNAIPTAARVNIVIDEEDYQPVVKAAEQFEKNIRREYRGLDDGIRVRVEKGSTRKNDVLSMDSQDMVLTLLLGLPNGVNQMSGTMPGLVQTSSNIGIVRTTDREASAPDGGSGRDSVSSERDFAVTVNIRSSVPSAQDAMELGVRALAEHVGAVCAAKGKYPAWELRERSALRDAAVTALTEAYGTEPKIASIHAGLECALFASRMRGLDAISIGPEIRDIHSPAERLSISSVGRTWDALVHLLALLT